VAALESPTRSQDLSEARFLVNGKVTLDPFFGEAIAMNSCNRFIKNLYRSRIMEV